MRSARWALIPTLLAQGLSLLAGCAETDDAGEPTGGACAPITAACHADAAPAPDTGERPPPALDGAVVEADAAPPPPADATLDAAAPPDAAPPDAAPEPVIVPAPGEHDLGESWIGSGQPSEARVRELITAGARIISLRYPDEDPFDEPAVVESLGGVFIRYPTQGMQYYEEAFREGMFDLYDEQHDLGGPVYLHCASSNRVGASWALYNALRRGVPAEEAIELGRAAGLTSLESLVRDVLGL